MAIVTSEKVFVDPKEEVTTVLERIFKTDKSRVILVIPLNSLLLSSYVTINILFREVTRSPKLSVIVTEDEYGTNIAEKAGFRVVQKVSLVTSQEWDQALITKRELLQSLQERKNALLGNFQGDEAMEEDLGLTPSDLEIEISNPPVQEIAPTEPPLDEIPVQSAKAPLLTQNNPDPSVLEAEEAMVQRFKKPRREPKIVNVEGIEILSGGDILSLEKSQPYDKIEDPINSLANPTMNPDIDVSNNIPLRRNINPQSVRSKFTGTDFTKTVSKKVGFGGFFKFLGDKNRNSNLRGDDIRDTTNKKRKKILIGSVVAILFLFLTGGYVLAFQASSVDITLELKKEDVSTSASIIVDTTSTDMTLDPLTIPGIVLQVENLSISRTGEASGEGKRGTKSQGVVDLLNKTRNEIILNAGTKITSLSTNLIYVLKNNTTVPAGTPDLIDPNSTTAKRLEDVPVEAADFGENYNMLGTDSNTDFSVDGYSRGSQLQATRYSDFTGGSSLNFTSVSGDNVAKVREEAMPELKKDGEIKLKLQVPTGYRYLPETLEFVEKDIKANPDVGAEAPEKNFNLSIAGSVTAIAVKDEDLEKAITHILEQDKSKGGEVSVKGVEDLKIDKIEKSESKLILTVSSNSSLQKNLTVDQIKEDIAGKSIADAREYINLLDEVEKYKITFSPDIVPESLRRVPTELTRITIKTK